MFIPTTSSPGLKTAMKKINIYLDPKLKPKIQDIRNKYKKSLSGLIDIVSKETWKILKEDKESIKKVIELEYLIKTKYKTSIHLSKNSELNALKEINLNLAKILTNLFYLYLTKEFTKYLEITEETNKKIFNKINQTLLITNDPYWNLNEQIRIQKRAMRILEGKK